MPAIISLFISLFCLFRCKGTKKMGNGQKKEGFLLWFANFFVPLQPQKYELKKQQVFSLPTG